MPVWCTYRDAARAEHVATETTAVAAALPSQAPQYQGAPLQVSLGQRNRQVQELTYSPGGFP